MNITIYSTADCAPCHNLTAWLTKLGQKYELKVVDSDPTFMQEFIAVSEGKIGVPFSVLTDDNGQETKISGFDLPKFKAALGIA